MSMKDFQIKMPWHEFWGYDVTAETAGKARYKAWIDNDVEDIHGHTFPEFCKVAKTTSFGVSK